MQNSLKVATWNVNSINSRMEHLLHYCDIHKPDVLLLQEIKCLEEKFPTAILEDMGYNLAVYGQKAYNGVSILSKYKISDITKKEFADWHDARYIEALVEKNSKCIRIASVYVPNGTAINSEKFKQKLNFIRELRSYMAKWLRSDELFLIGGDFNVAQENIDVYDPVSLSRGLGFHIDERTEIRAILNDGFCDSWRLLHDKVEQYSWWDYRDRESFNKDLGMRIDYILANPTAADRVINAGINQGYRAMLKPSDHVPVWCEVEL